MARGLSKDQSLIDQLTAARFVATESQIQLLASRYTNGLQTQDWVRGSYLKVLIAGTQKAAVEAGAKAPELLLENLNKTHDAYYAIVLRGVATLDVMDHEELDSEERTMRSLERNRRSNFARTAKAVLTAYIKAGGDLFRLDVMNTTKTELQAFATSMRSANDDLSAQHKARLAADRVEQLIRELADEDQKQAIVTVQELMARLSLFLSEFGRATTTKTMVALREHRPLKLAEGTFWPMSRGEVNRPAQVQ